MNTTTNRPNTTEVKIEELIEGLVEELKKTDKMPEHLNAAYRKLTGPFCNENRRTNLRDQFLFL